MRRICIIAILLAVAIWWAHRPHEASQAVRQATGQVGKALQPTPADAAPAAPPSAAAPSSSSPYQTYETMLCNLANEERKKRGLPLLEIDPKLADMARAHSVEMLKKNYFSHASPTTGLHDPMDRYVAEFGQRPHLIAENIYKMWTTGRLTEADFRSVHAGWMNSPHHRDNILRVTPFSPTHIGVGLAVKDGTLLATQNFSKP